MTAPFIRPCSLCVTEPVTNSLASTCTTRGTLLYLTHSAPLPLISGHRIRSYNLIRQLVARGWTIRLFALETQAIDADARAALEELCVDVVVHRFDMRSLSRPLRLVRDLVLRRPFQLDYFRDRAAERALRPLLERPFDLIVVAQLYMLGYVPKRLRNRVVFDSVNAEVRRLEAMRRGSCRMRRAAAGLQLGPVRALEADAARTVARVLAVSAEEQAHFEQISGRTAELIPNGVDVEAVLPRAPQQQTPEFLFMGSFDYSANVDAALHLINDIAPRMRTGATLTMLGVSPPRVLVDAAASSQLPARVTGLVPSIEPYVARSRALLVPLRHGGGTRLKILDALARGLPVVSTTIGCEGLGLVHGHDVLIADDPQDFAACIDRLRSDDDLCRRLAANGRHTVEVRFAWSEIGGRLDETLQEILAADDRV